MADKTWEIQAKIIYLCSSEEEAEKLQLTLGEVLHMCAQAAGVRGGGIVEIIPPTEDVPRHPVSKTAN